jgi:hypothetical protein
MNILKTIVAVSAIAVSSFSVNAEQLTVGGITWDSSYQDGSASLFDDFFAGATYNETMTAGGDLSGSGNVGTVNGTNAGTFCVVSGCVLTYSFTGFTVDATDPLNLVVDTSAGTLDFTVTEASGAVNTWLSFAAAGTATYNSNPSGTFTAFTAFFDVVQTAGTAWKNFDTATQANGTDFQMLATQAFGSSSNTFKSNSVPEPTTLAIFGLALVGFGVARRKA